MPAQEDVLDFLLVASANSKNAACLRSWRDFKDLIRANIKGQPSWTNVYPDSNRGEVEGWTSMKVEDDAFNVYNVCNAQNIKVHLFATSTMKSYFHLIRCNCAPHFPDSQSHSSSHSGINVTRINRFLNAILPGSEYDRHATADADGYFTPTYTPDTPTNSYLGVQYASPPIPAYSQSPAGLPVNLGQGGALTELRGIFIQGLHYGAKNSDVTSILYSIGLVPVQVRVLRNSQGNSKGCASVDCNTAQDAQRGVALLNGIIHMDKKLEVRLDREPTVVGHVSSFLVGGYPIVDSRNKSGCIPVYI